MAHGVDTLLLDESAADPSTPGEGEFWYLASTDRFRGRANGVNIDLAYLSELTTHTNDSANPHGTTLEQARTAGSTLAGGFSMGGFVISSAGSAVALTDVAQWGQVIDRIREQLDGLDWQESVLSRTNVTPGSPALGDRYLITATAAGLWVGQEDNITEWDGSDWQFIVPDNGTHVPVEDESNLVYVFNGSSWSALATVTDHGALTGLGDDDHTQYHTDARALTWLGTRSTTDLSEGTNLYYTESRVSANTDVAANTTHRGIVSGNPHAVTKTEIGLGFVQNILSNFASGTDPIVTDDSASNYSIGSKWVNVSADRTFTCTNAAVGAAVWVREDNEGAVSALVHKAGVAAAGGFALSGGRQKITVAFSSAFSDAGYSITFGTVTTGNKTFSPTAEGKLSSGFTINLGSASKADLTSVDWQAIKSGESA